jgi:hypothetical protein
MTPVSGTWIFVPNSHVLAKILQESNNRIGDDGGDSSLDSRNSPIRKNDKQRLSKTRDTDELSDRSDGQPRNLNRVRSEDGSTRENDMHTSKIEDIADDKPRSSKTPRDFQRRKLDLSDFASTLKRI